jgi:hypothetical protein
VNCVAHDIFHPTGCSDGISIASALDTGAAAIALALPLVRNSVSELKSLKRITTATVTNAVTSGGLFFERESAASSIRCFNSPGKSIRSSCRPWLLRGRRQDWCQAAGLSWGRGQHRMTKAPCPTSWYRAQRRWCQTLRPLWTFRAIPYHRLGQTRRGSKDQRKVRRKERDAFSCSDSLETPDRRDG